MNMKDVEGYIECRFGDLLNKLKAQTDPSNAFETAMKKILGEDYGHYDPNCVEVHGFVRIDGVPKVDNLAPVSNQNKKRSRYAQKRIYENNPETHIEEIFSHFLHNIIKPLQQRITVLEANQEEK